MRRNFRMETPIDPGRDPVCEAIELLLHDLVEQGHGPLESTTEGETIHLRFGAVDVDAPTFDIALVRLANRLIDDQKYCAIICSVLRDEVTASP